LETLQIAAEWQQTLQRFEKAIREAPAQEEAARKRAAELAAGPARRTALLAAARANHSVLDNPAPNALFLGFGESALNFELRSMLSKTNPEAMFRTGFTCSLA